MNEDFSNEIFQRVSNYDIDIIELKEYVKKDLVDINKYEFLFEYFNRGIYQTDKDDDLYYLLIQKTNDLYIKNKIGKNIIYFIFSSSWPVEKKKEKVSELIYNYNFNLSDKRNDQLIFHLNISTENLEFLIDNGLNLKAFDKNSSTIIMKFSVSLLKILAKKRREIIYELINIKDKTGNTALMLSNNNMDYEKILFLIENGANIYDLTDRGVEVLKNWPLKLLKYVDEIHPEFILKIINQKNKLGDNILIFERNADKLLFFLDHNIDIYNINNNGDTIIFKMDLKQLKIVDEKYPKFISKIINIKNNQGLTALVTALDDEDKLSFFLDHGAEIDFSLFFYNIIEDEKIYNKLPQKYKKIYNDYKTNTPPSEDLLKLVAKIYAKEPSEFMKASEHVREYFSGYRNYIKGGCQNLTAEDYNDLSFYVDYKNGKERLWCFSKKEIESIKDGNYELPWDPKTSLSHEFLKTITGKNTFEHKKILSETKDKTIILSPDALKTMQHWFGVGFPMGNVYFIFPSNVIREISQTRPSIPPILYRGMAFPTKELYISFLSKCDTKDYTRCNFKTRTYTSWTPLYKEAFGFMRYKYSILLTCKSFTSDDILCSYSNFENFLSKEDEHIIFPGSYDCELEIIS